MYEEYKILDLPLISKEILEKWRTEDTFHSSIQLHEGCREYTFYEGPPSANGEPGIHHVLARTIKDLFCRYKTLRGYHVIRKSGWDTHGLPVELQVEKSLGITKEDIGIKISVEDYNKECLKAVMKFKDRWQSMTMKLGYWVDLDNPYITCDNKYIESCWWVFKNLFDKGLIYQGYSIQPYSPAAGTGLSSHELNQPGCYRDVSDLTATVQFKLLDKEETYILAWTTTPWTLPANSALAIGKNITYIKVETINPYTKIPIKVILAKDAVSRYFNSGIPMTIIEEYLGSDLIGLKYEQLLPFIKPQNGNAFVVIEGDFVTTTEGTGIVHIAPSFGADDQRVAQQNNIVEILSDENLPIVDRQGRFVKEITPWAGRYVKEAYEADTVKQQSGYKPLDVEIVIYLKERNRIFQSAKHVHSYPHCWRTDKPLLYYPLQAWFIKTTSVKDKMLELNETINWKPASTGQGRFANWIKNIVDWNVSRDRFWGIPIPIWQTEDKSETICIGSIEELRKWMCSAVSAGIMKDIVKLNNLHRPYVDDIVLMSPQGKPMYRVSQVIDVWFDSGSMPYAQWYYPFENADIFKKHFPADFVAEGVDQTRGWFFTLHALSTMLFNSVAYKNVISNGLLLDKNGNKMSKRLGNTIDPFALMDKYGADAVRWYILTNAFPWDNIRFSVEDLEDVYKKMFITLYNTYNFFAIYANLDNYQWSKSRWLKTQQQYIIDKWILSRLNSLIKDVSIFLDDYESTKAARAIQNFVVDDLSNWYVRLNRKRCWKNGQSDDKIIVYDILFKCLNDVAILASPFIPFYTDKLYRDLNGTSVHLANYPNYDCALLNEDIERKMSVVRNIVSTIHALRKQIKIRVRQPLASVKVCTNENIDDFTDIILQETNIKSLIVINKCELNNFCIYEVKPNFKNLGERCKNKQLLSDLQQLSQSDICKLLSEKSIVMGSETIDYSDVILTVKGNEGSCVYVDNGIGIVLDTNITHELLLEGIARDFINAIQNLRKTQSLNINDQINLYFDSEDSNLVEAINVHKETISKEILAVDLQQTKIQQGNIIDVEGIKVDVLMNVIKQV